MHSEPIKLIIDSDLEFNGGIWNIGRNLGLIFTPIYEGTFSQLSNLTGQEHRCTWVLCVRFLKARGGSCI